MLLGDLIPLIRYDQIIEVYIEDDYDSPFFRGNAMDMPWHLMKLEIGYANHPKTDKPIYSYTDEDENCKLEDILVINTQEPSLRDPKADFPQ